MSYTERSGMQSDFKDKNELFGVFEFKLCKGTSMPFSALEEHQEKNLLAVSCGEGLYHKISDVPVSAMMENKNVRFTRKKPFDAMRIRFQRAYVVIMFYTPRTKKNVYYIDIRKFTACRAMADRKSMTEQMAYDAADFAVSFLAGGEIIKKRRFIQ